MTRLQALRAAKDAGFTHAILHPYTYHKRTIESHIKEAEEGENDPDYPGSSAASEKWTFDPAKKSITGESGDWYFLVRKS